MTFLTLSTGMKPSGSEEAAFGSKFKIIPNNSKLLAFIDSIVKNGQHGWKIVWEIVQGEYKGQTVWQFLTLENPNYPSLADQNKEMFARIFLLAGMQIPEYEPNYAILSQMERKVMGLKIVQDSYIKDGKLKEVNKILEVHPSAGFIEEIGTKIAPKVPESKYNGIIPKSSTYDEINPPFPDSAISF